MGSAKAGLTVHTDAGEAAGPVETRRVVATRTRHALVDVDLAARSGKAGRARAVVRPGRVDARRPVFARRPPACGEEGGHGPQSGRTTPRRDEQQQQRRQGNVLCQFISSIVIWMSDKQPTAATVSWQCFMSVYLVHCHLDERRAAHSSNGVKAMFYVSLSRLLSSGRATGSPQQQRRQGNVFLIFCYLVETRRASPASETSNKSNKGLENGFSVNRFLAKLARYFRISDTGSQ